MLNLPFKVSKTIYTVQGRTLSGFQTFFKYQKEKVINLSLSDSLAKKKISTSLLVRIVILFIAFLVLPSNVKAIENPKSSPNNKFGIHIIDENDLEQAAELVNSGGGKWGYVTVVIREDERDVSRWQAVFDKMRRLNLIPLVRVATATSDKGWKKPDHMEIDKWVSFFSQLNWVIKNRYVIISNEPNQEHEWEGKVNPKEYGEYLLEFSRKLKENSDEYFVLPAGLDAAAPNGPTTMSEEKFLRDSLKAVPEMYKYIDGWTSHSYPKAGVEVEKQTGIGSLRTYEWELNFLNELGVATDSWPIFITETGWRHKDNETRDSLGKRYEEAIGKVWSDERVVAITPFVLSYKAAPYQEFSWLDPAGNPHSFFQYVKTFPKTEGRPVQISNGKITGSPSIPIVQAEHGIFGILIVENTGQSIWKNDEVTLPDGQLFPFLEIEPGDRRILFFRLQAPNSGGLYISRLQLRRFGVFFGNETTIYTRIIKIPSITDLFKRN